MALHFVGFRGDEYLRAVEVFPGDVAVFAKGTADDAPSVYSFPDIREE